MTIRVLAVGNGVTTQTDHRSLITSLVTANGTTGVRAGLIPSQNPPAWISNASAMTVTVGPFKAIVPNTAGVGHYLVQSDNTTDLEFDPGEAGVTRTDRIIIRVYNNPQDGSGLETVALEYLKGQSSGSATALPDNSLLLWEFPVPAGASAGSGGINFTSIGVDHRVYTTAAGGIIPTQAGALSFNISSPYDGLPAYNRNSDILYIFDGTAWRPAGQVAVASEASFTTSVATPATGTLGVTRDTRQIYIYNGSSWEKFWNPPLAQLRQTSAQTISNATWTAIQFQSEDLDTHGGHSTSSNTSRYTIQKTGIYQLSGAVSWASNATGARWSRWTKNGTEIAGSGRNENAASGGQHLADARTINVSLVAGDYVELQAFQTSGGNLDTYVGVNYAQSSAAITFLV